MPPQHPLQRAGLLRRTAPFGVALALGFVTVAFVDITRPRLVTAASVLAVAMVLSVALVDWERLPRAASALPPLAVVAVVGLLREGTGGLSDPVNFEILLLLPVIWFALYGTPGELAAAVAAGAITYAISILRTDEPGDEWVTALLWPLVAAVIGRRVQRLVRRVTRLSRTDQLTGVANRASWWHELERHGELAARTGMALSVALLDLDHFKRVNDERGHRAGDEVLRACADAWRRELRRTDLLARYGGEEFAVLLPSAEAAAAGEVAERLRAATPAGITCSIGVAVRAGREPLHETIERADAALYRAKARGRDRVEVAPAPVVAALPAAPTSPAAPPAAR